MFVRVTKSIDGARDDHGDRVARLLAQHLQRWRKDRNWPVSETAKKQLDAQQVRAGEAGGAGKDPRGRVTRLVEEVGLDHEHGAQLAGFAAETRLEVGQVEVAVADVHSSRFSPARWSSSDSSARVDSRVAKDASR